MKKIMLHACLVLLAFTFTSGVALATTYTIPAGNGTLSYTATVTTIACQYFIGHQLRNGQYYDVAYTSFSYTLSGTTTPLSGSVESVDSPDGIPAGDGCPASSFPPVLLTGGAVVEMVFTPSGETGGVTNMAGTLYPKFKIASIIYDTPGNNSNNGFTTTLTDGTTTSTGSNFGVGVTDTFSVTGGFLGSGDTLSWTAGVSSTSGNTTEVSDTIAQGTGVLNSSNTSGPNAINHQQDLFILWINPAVFFTQTGTKSDTYSMGTQLQTTGDPSPGSPELQDHIEVYAQAMTANSSGVTTVPVQTLKPQVVDGQTLPGLANICANPTYYPNSCTLANQCGCVPGDFTAVLSQDPLLSYTSTESPLNANTSSSTLCTNPAATAKCRYVPIMTINNGTTQVVELLQGPDDVGGGNPINTFTQTDSTQTTQTLNETDSYTAGYGWDVKWGFGGSDLDFGSMTLFTWTNTESAGEINGSDHQMSVSLSSSTVGCSEYIPIFEDTVYHTFVFQGQAGDTSCP